MFNYNPYDEDSEEEDSDEDNTVLGGLKAGEVPVGFPMPEGMYNTMMIVVPNCRYMYCPHQTV